MSQKPVKELLITKLERTDETRANLIGQGNRFPDIYLFELSDLALVGIADYAALPVNQVIPVRFWADYVESDKLNKAGNPYKDLVGLRPYLAPDTHNPTPAAASDAILSELAQIRTLLQEILLALSHDPGYRDPRIDGSNETSDVPAVLIGDAHLSAQAGKFPAEDANVGTQHAASPPARAGETDSQAMRAFYARAGEAIRVGRMKATSVNELIDTAGRAGWKAALIRLDTVLEMAKMYGATV